jgi:hypothetical protein
VLGPYEGKLDNRGETLELYKPDTPQPPGRPDACFVPYLLVDRVRYEDRDPWPSGPDGTGSVLERVAPELYGNDPVHWRSASPTPGWQELRIDSVEQRDGVVALRFRALAGLGYTVQYKTALAPGLWLRLTDLAPQSVTGIREVTDAVLTPHGRRFYRVVFPPQ